MRDSLIPVAVALLCIVALGLGAATLSTDLGGGDSGPAPVVTAPEGQNDTSMDGEPDEDIEDPEQTQPRLLHEDGECVAGYDPMEIVWVVTIFVFGVAGLVFIRTRNLMLGAITVPLVILPAMFIMALLLAFFGCPVPGEQAVTEGTEQGFANETFSEAFGDGNGEDESAPVVNRFHLGGLFLGLALIVLILGYLIKRTKSSSDGGEQMRQTVDETSDHVIASAAGDAADELADDTENGVYRAWARMAEVLDVEHPDTSTPREFADAALAAGLNPEDVSELTELFEEVRYGTTDVTPAQEDRAREALRRIEQTHSKLRENDQSPGTKRDAPPVGER